MPVEQSMGIKDVLVVVLPAAVPALLAAVSFMFREWREDRDAEHRRDEALARAERELTFWRKWRDAALDADTDDAALDVREQMRDVCARLQRDVDESLTQYGEVRAERSRNFLADLLLLRHNASPSIWVARILYYSYTAFAVLCIGIGFSMPATGDAAKNSWIFNTLVNTFVAVVVLIPSFILWRLVRAMERRSQRVDNVPRHTTRAKPGPHEPLMIDVRGVRTEDLLDQQEDQQPSWGTHSTFRSGPSSR